MKKIILLSLLIISFGQSLKAQKVGYIDSGFILNKMPEYKQAQGEVEKLSQKWQGDLDKLSQSIEKEFQEFKAEEVLLTTEMKKIRLDTIDKHKKKLADTQKKFFGFEGLLFLKRQEIIKPIQDKVFEAIEKVCRTKRVDIMFDKSADLVMLYTNPVHDYTDFILEELDLVTDNSNYGSNEANNNSNAPAGTEESINNSNTPKR